MDDFQKQVEQWNRVIEAKRYFDMMLEKYSLNGYERFLEAKGLQKLLFIGGYHGNN